MMESTNDPSQLPFEERYTKLKELYADAIDSNQPVVNQMIYHLGNMKSYSMTLCGLAILRPELTTMAGGITRVDLFSSLCIAAEAVQEILFLESLDNAHIQNLVKIINLCWNLLRPLRTNPYDAKNITRQVFLLAFASLLMECLMLDKEIIIDSIPEQLTNWLRSCSPPMLLEHMRVQENLTNLESNLRYLLNKEEKRGRDS